MRMYPKPIKKNGKFICPECGHESKSHGNYNNHFIRHHSDKMPGKVKEDTVLNIKEVAQEVIDSLPPIEKVKTPKENKNRLKPEVWSLIVSDYHFGQLVKGVEVGGLSEYNPSIAKERMALLVERVIRFRDYHPNRPNELVINILGDMVDGSILRGNQQSNIEFGVVKQVIECTEVLVDAINKLSEHFPRIRVYGVYGNHARLTPNPKDAHPSENFDLLLYHYIAQRFEKSKRITVDYTEAQHMIVEINKHNFWLDHGDAIKGWAGYPYYGADRQKNNIMAMLGLFTEKIDYVLMGHHHRFGWFNEIIANGSFVGGDLFSIGRLRKMGIAQQVLFSVNEKHGVVWARPINLSEPIKGSVKIYRG